MSPVSVLTGRTLLNRLCGYTWVQGEGARSLLMASADPGEWWDVMFSRCLVWFEDESLCSDGNEPVESETSVKGNFGPLAFLFLPGWFHFPSWFISLISQPGPMTGDFYYAFTNPYKASLLFLLPSQACHFLSSLQLLGCQLALLQ